METKLDIATTEQQQNIGHVYIDTTRHTGTLANKTNNQNEASVNEKTYWKVQVQ